MPAASCPLTGGSRRAAGATASRGTAGADVALQARLAPELEYLDPGVAEGIMQLRAEELQELVRWVREQRAQKA